MVQGETVPYIICVEKDSEGHVTANQKGLAERAHHPEEINAASNLAVDAEYYLTQQVHLRVTRLWLLFCGKSIGCRHQSKDMHGTCALLWQLPGCTTYVLLQPAGAQNQTQLVAFSCCVIAVLHGRHTSLVHAIVYTVYSLYRIK